MAIRWSICFYKSLPNFIRLGTPKEITRLLSFRSNFYYHYRDAYNKTMVNTQTVDEFITQKVLLEYRPLVEAFRKLVNNKFPQLSEEMRGGTEKYYGTPVYRYHHLLVTISPTKQGITYAFADGKQFEDKYNLLEGVGNRTRNIRLTSPDEFDEQKMSYYLQQAIEIEDKKQS